MTVTTVPQEEFEAALAGIGEGVPDAAGFARLTTLSLASPAAERLATLDPFSPSYRASVLDLYLGLRGRGADAAGYVPERDEADAHRTPEAIWSGLPPWSFGDSSLVGEHVLAYGQVLRHLSLPPGGSVLEYGPGSGQILLMLARSGVRACGVDISAEALLAIRRQAEIMGVAVATERARFGEGFADERFDAVVFYEAFHHALDFEALLLRLHDRIKPGGRVVLCGEPIVHADTPAIPYPWGPRLDALSVFCIRRFGWMELGFTHAFFVEAARRAGWRATFHPMPDCGRACLYVLEPGNPEPPGAAAAATLPPPAPRSLPWRVVRRIVHAASPRLAARIAAALRSRHPPSEESP